MVRRRTLLSMMIAMMAGFYALGASRVALACVASECSACPTAGPGCERAMSANNCAPACAAVVPLAPDIPISISHFADVSSEIAAFEVALYSGPEPPPPRSA